MQLRIQVTLEPEPQDGSRGNYGSMTFNETQTIRGQSFSAIAAVFTKVHELLEQVKKEYDGIVR